MIAWLFPQRRWPDLSLEEIRKRARLIVIDDMGFPILTCS